MKAGLLFCLLSLGAVAVLAKQHPGLPYNPVRAVIQMCAGCSARRSPQLRRLRESVQNGEYGEQLTVEYVRGEKTLLLVYGPFDYLLGRYTIHNEPVEKLHKVVQAFGFKRIVVNDDDTISDNSSSNSSLKQPAIGNAASSSSSVGISSLSSSSAANQGVQPSSEVQAQVATASLVDTNDWEPADAADPTVAVAAVAPAAVAVAAVAPAAVAAVAPAAAAVAPAAVAPAAVAPAAVATTLQQ